MPTTYKAFISYSHAADGKLAPAIQSALQKIGKPWNRLRNFKVFRDESSLSVNPHLWSTIKSALDESEYFIYLASPEASRSEWVQKEIDYWIQNKPISNLILVLTDGEFTWGNRDKINCIPANLIDAFAEEPLFIDLREVKSEKDYSKEPPF